MTVIHGSRGQPIAFWDDSVIAVEYDDDSNPIYIGFAKPGTAKSVSHWQIFKLTYDSDDNITDLQWADGDEKFNKVWNNRATYSYS